MTKQKTPPTPAGGTPVDCLVGRLGPERAAYDAWYAAATFETMGHEWTWAGWQAGAEWQREQVPTLEDAHAIGASGGQTMEAERLAFEAWMRGHCWALCATWTGSGYIGKGESVSEGRYVCRAAMATRRMWAAWRDRAALARLKTPNVAIKRGT